MDAFSSTPRHSKEFSRLSAMTSHQVGQYMAACGFADYEHIFKEHNISGDRLLQLTNEDLREIGFSKVGDRLVMQQEIAGLRAGRRTAWRGESFEEKVQAEKRCKLWQEEARVKEPLAEKSELKSEEAKYKRKIQKLKQRWAEDLRSVRGRLCRAMTVACAREDGCMGHAVLKAWQRHVAEAHAARAARQEAALAAAQAAANAAAAQQAAPVANDGATEALLALLSASCGRSAQLAALRAWHFAARQARHAAAHEAELRSQEEKATQRSTAALAQLRNQLRALRCQGTRVAKRNAQHRALVALFAPFSVWLQQTREARHAARLRAELEKASMHSVAALRSSRAEVQAFRAVGRRSACAAASRRALLCLSPLVSAWSRQAKASLSTRRLRPGEVLLNSGEAAKRAQQQLQQLRAQHAEQLEALERSCTELRAEASQARMAAAAAARREARVENIARRHENAARRGEELAALLACTKAWMGEVLLARSTAALRKEAEARVAESLARQRLESRGALHQAWSEAAEKARQAAQLERQLQHLKEEIQGEVVRPEFDGSRPTTALGIEERLRRADEAKARLTATSWPRSSEVEEDISMPSHPPRHMGDAEVLQLDEVLTAEAAVQADRSDPIDAEAPERWRDEVVAAREGRKGLFIAALNEQAKYWRAQAWHAWRRVLLQERCKRLDSLLDRKKATTPRSARGKG
ncbi:unnamed protein product [Effrenium voratum]|uniref:SAM domain-containing protein n=1 Tax=Effrenium voratum TaxID=2562239 RepID=A0AA36N4Y8_9DINO|nr:unnamed protein product [Effrenium voratum]